MQVVEVDIIECIETKIVGTATCVLNRCRGHYAWALRPRIRAIEYREWCTGLGSEDGCKLPAV